jgi:hypothetical protein
MVVLLPRRPIRLVLPAVILFVAAGCSIFAPKGTKPRPRPPADYRIRTAPENVIHNIETAYVWMNADEYLDCLSEDFIFYPAEDDVGGPVPELWFKSDERIVHENMFDEDGNVDSVTLQLTNTGVEHDLGANAEDPLDDTYIYTEDVDLYVHLHGTLSYHASTPSHFHIRVDSDQVGPDGEVLYEIFEWHDTSPPPTRGSGSSQDPSVEAVTLAQLRALYAE